MKNRIRTGAIPFIIFLVSISASAADKQTQPRLVTVTGDAEVKVAPDEIILTFGVETWDKNLGLAKIENDEVTKKVLGIAKKFGIESKHIQTDHISIEPRYAHQHEHRKFIGYFVRKTIVLTLRDISKFEDLLSGVLETGVNYVHGIQFRTTELRKHRDRARALAIKAAQEKANDLARELGQKVGKPHSIREDQSGWWSWYNSLWGAGWRGGMMAQNVVQNMGGNTRGAESGIAPGQISVTARVTVSFELK